MYKTVNAQAKLSSSLTVCRRLSNITELVHIPDRHSSYFWFAGFDEIIEVGVIAVVVIGSEATLVNFVRWGPGMMRGWAPIIT